MKNKSFKRRIINLDRGWTFYKGRSELSEDGNGESIDLPHTWNAIDGQDGGGDYFRGTSLYTRRLDIKPEDGLRYYLEFRGANSEARVFLDDIPVCSHSGGYSSFRADITKALSLGKKKIYVLCDNSPSNSVYPQMADFTFYGGLYRSVYLIVVPKEHFDLEYMGGTGIKITPELFGTSATVTCELYTTPLKEDQRVRVTLFDRDGERIDEKPCLICRSSDDKPQNGTEKSFDKSRPDEGNLSICKTVKTEDYNNCGKTEGCNKTEDSKTVSKNENYNNSRKTEDNIICKTEGCNNGGKAQSTYDSQSVKGSESCVSSRCCAADSRDADITAKAREISHEANGKSYYGAISEARTYHIAKFDIPDARLWNGVRDPYLYSARAELWEGDELIDAVSAKFGCRSFDIDPERGFILNGEEYPLRGVSRHQDRAGIGNALLPEHHKEDMEIILELGANAVRLAHYQHDSQFLDLCDEAGLIVWAEIPYISKHLTGGKENTLSQMRELIVQNYNHPSIAMWGLSNEISIGGSSDELVENHKRLNELCHALDQTRKTVVAAVSMCHPDDPYLKIPDAVAYNHYFGWYGGEPSMMGPWFEKFHKDHPNVPIGVSEYGAEALDWHSPTPTQGDYTEEYQALYHEQMIKQLFPKKYIFATFVWNMFDFGADARGEGGEDGRNHKGLVTFDRSYKKDAFFAYRAHLSDKPFVHIAGKRYKNRHEDQTEIKVYSNLPEVELIVNGKSIGKKCAPDHFFTFTVKNEGVSRIVARAGGYADELTVRKVGTPDENYILRDGGGVINWFDVSAPDGRFSINDKISDILRVKEGGAVFGKFLEEIAKKASSEKKPKGAFEIDLKDAAALEMLGGFTPLRLTSMLKMTGITLTKEELLDLNSKLNEIEK